MPIGVIKFMPVEAFTDPLSGLNRTERSEYMRKIYDEEIQQLPTTADWPRVKHDVRRLTDGGIEYVIETSTPAFTAMLRFRPEQPDEGHYEIRFLPYGGVEQGRTIKVMTIPCSRLLNFDLRSAPLPEDTGKKCGWLDSMN
jgi:hypothetical protein